VTNGEILILLIEKAIRFHITQDSYSEDGTDTESLLLNDFWKGHVAAVPREKFGASFWTLSRVKKMVFVSMTIILKFVLSEILGPLKFRNLNGNRCHA
jgi:hypothetical protein